MIELLANREISGGEFIVKKIEKFDSFLCVNKVRLM